MSKAIDDNIVDPLGDSKKRIKKLAVIVVEYPKATETFILRDLMVFHRAGVEVDLHHLSPFGTDVLHGFAAATRDMAHYTPFFGAAALGATFRALFRHPLIFLSIVWAIFWAYLSRPKWMFKTLGLIPKALAIGEHAKKNGVEHIHGEFAGHPGATGWIINRFFGIPYSVSCRAHDIFRTQALLDRKLGEAAFVRTISAFNKDFLLEKVPGLQADNIHVIHSSVDLDAIPALDRPSNEPFTIVYVGSLQIRKGVDVLLSALAKANDALGEWRCEIIGSGPLEDELKKTAASLNLNRVTFWGQQPFEKVSDAMKRASVCVAPSIIGPDGRTEGIPNVMIEALAHQRPAISSNLSGIPELLRPGQTGWLTEAGNVDQFAAALLDIKNDPARAYEMARAGRQVVAEEFDVNTNAMTQIKLFSGHLAS